PRRSRRRDRRRSAVLPRAALVRGRRRRIAQTRAADDPVFAQFAVKGFPVTKQLAKNGDVSDEQLYALSFGLIERGDASIEESDQTRENTRRAPTGPRNSPSKGGQ